MPIRDAEVASRVLGKTVEALAERFVINFLPESEQPFGRRHFVHGSGCNFPVVMYQGRRCASPHIRRRAPSTPNMGWVRHDRNYVRGNKKSARRRLAWPR